MTVFGARWSGGGGNEAALTRARKKKSGKRIADRRTGGTLHNVAFAFARFADGSQRLKRKNEIIESGSLI